MKRISLVYFGNINFYINCIGLVHSTTVAVCSIESLPAEIIDICTVERVRVGYVEEVEIVSR